MKKNKKINYGNSRNNNMPDVNRDKKKKKRNNNMSDGNTDKKKKYLKNHCYKRKKMLNYLINCIEELKNENF